MAKAVLSDAQVKLVQTQLDAAANRWLEAQKAYITARLNFDVIGFINRNAEEQARQNMNAARLAASAAMDAYYKLNNEVRSKQKLQSALVSLAGNR